jgi:hypothetical protein
MMHSFTRLDVVVSGNLNVKLIENEAVLSKTWNTTSRRRLW